MNNNRHKFFQYVVNIVGLFVSLSLLLYLFIIFPGTQVDSSISQICSNIVSTGVSLEVKEYLQDVEKLSGISHNASVFIFMIYLSFTLLIDMILLINIYMIRKTNNARKGGMSTFGSCSQNQN